MSADLAADYIVVGAGSAGAALAARLSEDPQVSVLLLEAGGPDAAMELHVPAAFSKLFRGGYDWNYDTVPQPELEGRTIFWPRGKTLGGSSSLNATICPSSSSMRVRFLTFSGTTSSRNAATLSASSTPLRS